MLKILVKTLPHFDPSFSLPVYETPGAAGMDVRASLENQGSLTITPGARLLISTGLSFEIPQGYEVQVRPRSGLSLKTGLMVVNSPGTIDSDYRGEVKIIMGNLGQNDEIVKHGDRIAQLVVMPVLQAVLERADDLSSTQRGIGGFGSTGVHLS